MSFQPNATASEYEAVQAEAPDAASGHEVHPWEPPELSAAPVAATAGGPAAGSETEAAATPELASGPAETADAAVVDAGQTPVETRVWRLPIRRGARGPLADVQDLGDPGRQRTITTVLGRLTTGVSDTELDFATVSPWEIRACSTRGMSHRSAGTPRQDTFAVAGDERLLVAAVADGVSEGPQSHVAAEIAARVACKLALDQASTEGVDAVDWSGICTKVSSRIVHEAGFRQIVPRPEDPGSAAHVRSVRRAMSTTLIIAVLSRQPGPTGALPGLVVSLAGDSGAYALGVDGLSLIAGGKAPDSGGVTSSSVQPLPGRGSPELYPMNLNPGDGIVLVSDGLSDLLGDGDSSVGQQFWSAWQSPPTASEFFASVNTFAKTFDDDRTAVGLWALPQVAPTIGGWDGTPPTSPAPDPEGENG